MEDCNPVQKLRAGVMLHREALKYADFLSSTFISLAVIFIVMGTASLCLNLFRLLRALVLQNTSEILPAFFLCAGHFMVLFFGNYYGQKISDHDSKIFKTAYKTSWYKAPINMQKLLLFIMQKTTKTYSLNIGNVLIASMETFNKLFNTMISSFMMLYSLMKW